MAKCDLFDRDFLLAALRDAKAIYDAFAATQRIRTLSRRIIRRIERQLEGK